MTARSNGRVATTALIIASIVVIALAVIAPANASTVDPVTRAEWVGGAIVVITLLALVIGLVAFPDRTRPDSDEPPTFV